MENWSFWYIVIKKIMGIPYRLFYKNYIITGRENIPKDKPVFFAPNHQNAIMDPLAIIYSVNKQPVFLARGDAFNNPTIAKIFAILKILPVYRQHDGREALKKNEDIFQTSVNVLKNNRALCLFPEAKHNEFRRLRILKKGVQRITFQALEDTNFKLDIKIIPTGIYYDNRDNSKSTVIVNYGKPINALDYVDVYKENPNNAIIALKADMTKSIKSLIINIEDKDYYDLYEDLRLLYNSRLIKFKKLANKEINKFKTDQKIIEKVSNYSIKNEGFLPELNTKVESYKNLISENNLSIKSVVKGKKHFFKFAATIITLIIGFPLFLYGVIFNIIPFKLTRYISKNLLTDNQYISSVKYAVGSVFMYVYYSILVLLSILVLDNWYILAFAFSLPFSAIIASYYSRLYSEFINDFKYKILNKSAEKEILNSQTEFYNMLDNIF